MTDPNLSPDQLAQLQAEPEPTLRPDTRFQLASGLSPMARRWLKAQHAELYGMPPEINKPTCWNTGRSWIEQ